MPNRHNSRLQEMSGILSVSPKNRHRRLHEAKKNGNQTTGGQREEIAHCDLTRAADFHCFAASLVGPHRVLAEYESRTITCKASRHDLRKTPLDLSIQGRSVM